MHSISEYEINMTDVYVRLCFICRHYRQAYSLLGELKTSDINVLEIKIVAGFVNYKVCVFKV